MNNRDLARRIYHAAHLEGSFRLHSGQLSREYFDKYLFESDPALLGELTAHLAELVPPETQLLAGLELGGVPIATALALRLGLPVVFVRKVAKAYGTCKLAEGADVQGKRLCIIEDVVTTGGQIVTSAAALRALGATVADVICVIQREASATVTLRERGLTLRSLFTMDELKDVSDQGRGGNP